MMKGRTVLAVGVITAILVSIAAHLATPKQVTFYVYDASAKPPWAGKSPKEDKEEVYKIIAKWDLP